MYEACVSMIYIIQFQLYETLCLKQMCELFPICLCVRINVTATYHVQLYTHVA